MTLASLGLIAMSFARAASATGGPACRNPISAWPSLWQVDMSSNSGFQQFDQLRVHELVVIPNAQANQRLTGQHFIKLMT